MTRTVLLMSDNTIMYHRVVPHGGQISVSKASKLFNSVQLTCLFFGRQGVPQLSLMGKGVLYFLETVSL